MKYQYLLGSLVALFGCFFLLGQTPNSTPPCGAAVVKFVASPYPRAAKDSRMAGTAVAEISVARDGSVSVQRIQAHPVFEKPVKDALEQWRFGPAGQEEKLQVTVRFEFDETWEGTDKHPLTAETRVSAELPSMVHVVTGLKGLEVTNSSEKKERIGLTRKEPDSSANR